MYELRKETMGRRIVRIVMTGLTGRDRWALWKWTTLFEGYRVSRRSDISEWHGFGWLTYAATPNSTALPWKRSVLAIEDGKSTRNAQY